MAYYGGGQSVKRSWGGLKTRGCHDVTAPRSSRVWLSKVQRAGSVITFLSSGNAFTHMLLVMRRLLWPPSAVICSSAAYQAAMLLPPAVQHNMLPTDPRGAHSSERQANTDSTKLGLRSHTNSWLTVRMLVAGTASPTPTKANIVEVSMVAARSV